MRVLFVYIVHRKCDLVAVFVTVAVRTKTIWNQISWIQHWVPLPRTAHRLL